MPLHVTLLRCFFGGAAHPPSIMIHAAVCPQFSFSSIYLRTPLAHGLQRVMNDNTSQISVLCPVLQTCVQCRLIQIKCGLLLLTRFSHHDAAAVAASAASCRHPCVLLALVLVLRCILSIARRGIRNCRCCPTARISADTLSLLLPATRPSNVAATAAAAGGSFGVGIASPSGRTGAAPCPRLVLCEPPLQLREPFLFGLLLLRLIDERNPRFGWRREERTRELRQE